MEKRPTRHSKEVVAEAARVITDDVIQWMAQRGEDEPDAEERADMERQIAEAADLADDGFEIVYRLKRDHYWECDSELVDVLDDFWWQADKAKDKAVAEWVKHNGITCPFVVGDTVTFKDFGKGAVTGEVTKIDAEHAIIYVFCESLGHVREGSGTHARLVAFEDAKAAARAA